MKRTILLLAASLMLTAVSATAQNKIDKQGRRQGHWIRTDKDGSKIFEGDFVDGLETGTFTYYYQNGTVRIRNTYSQPGRYCLHEAYDEDGHLLARGHYNQRNRDGQWQFYNEKGQLIKEASYNMGIKHGPHIVFDNNGDTAEVVTWADNHRHGRWWKRLNKKGYIEANYVHGGLEGRLVEYDEEGLLAREGHYRNGLKEGSYKYYEKGILTVRERWYSGLMSDREILLHVAQAEQWISIHDIVCLAAQGKSKTVVVLKENGKELIAQDESERVFNRAGDELFALANRKSRIMVARHSIQGLGKDNEGRQILLLDPQPSFTIFPDEDAIKMVHSVQQEDTPIEELLK